MTISPIKPQVAADFVLTELLPALVICEAIEDIYGWGNANNDKPAFLVYIGYNTPQEREDWMTRLSMFWKIDRTNISYRRSTRVKRYWWELKIRGMKRSSDPAVFDLEYMSESKDYGLDFLEYLIQMNEEYDHDNHSNRY